MLIHYILSGIPVLLEGPTGTSKTRTTLIACDYITNIINKDSKFTDSLLRFNLSAETKIDDLLVKFTGDNNSASGLKVEEGQFFKAYTKGHKILLDEINLAPREVLECIQQALDSKVLSVESSGKILKKYPMHKNFGIIATQNPNKGAFANKRQELGIGFLSRFQKINFPNFTKGELIDIAKGLAKQNNYKGNEDILTDIVSFHMDWQEETNLVDDVQCFTIREIEGIIRALAQNKNIYDTIMTVYGARYQRELKEQLKKKLQKYETLKKLNPSPLKLPEDFPHCYKNDNLCEAVASVLFSLTNERHAIIVGEDESGITQVARWCAECFNKMMNKEQENKNESCLCLCTKNLQCSDLIGQTKPCPKNDKSESNEILKFIPGFLVEAIKEGKTVVLDCINEANATVGERLNGLLDKKNNADEEYFDLPENTEELRIPIHKNFRMICTCNINNIKDMSPAFVNRFDVIVLENQLEKLNDTQLGELISNLFISLERIPQKKNKANKIGQNENEFQIIEEDNNEENEEEYEEIENVNDKDNQNNVALKKEDIIKKEKEFLTNEKNLINKIINKIKLLPEKKIVENKSKDYSHLKTITSINRFCYGVMKLRALFNQIKYKNENITDDDIINTVFEMLFRDDNEKLEISESIKNCLLKELIEENRKKMEGFDRDKYEKYFFEKSESLKKFVLIVYISSLINLYLCVVSPPGSGKTTAARAIAEIRAKILMQNIPFYIHTHHSSTKPNDFYGTTTISESEVIFKEGSLTLAIMEGSVYIADEFNISSELNMKSVTPVLEQTFNQDLIIPGIEGITSIDPNFFFIICQNDVGTFGRNELPDKIKIKLRKIVYPEQSKEEIESICSSINSSLYEEGEKNKLDDLEARYCGDFMIEVNQKNLTPQPWSLRDISKIFLRLKNQKMNNEEFKDIGTAANLLFYALSSVTKEQSDEEVVDKLIKSLQSNFKERANAEDLKKVYRDEAKLYNELDNKTKIRKYYIQKHNSFILLDKIDENSKRNEEEKKKKRKRLEKYSRLPRFLECLFKMKLSNYDEPLLLSGPTCYKTYASKMLLKKADVVSLNQESTIPQLLGASFFYPPIEDKKFCLRLIYEILEIPNIEIELNKIDNWNEYKDEILKTIEEKMPLPESSFFMAITNLKKKLFSEEKTNEKSLINMEIEFKPGLILSAILNKKSLILKDMPQVKTIVLERFNELFSGKHNLTLVEDIPGTLTTKENKELRNFNQNFRVIATCKTGDEMKLSEALLSRFTVIACEQYTEEEESVVLESSAVEDKDINEFNNLAQNFNLSERLNCLRITECLDKFNNDHENNLKLSVYILQKGLLEQRERQIENMKQDFNLNLPNYEDGNCPFEDPENSKYNGIQYLQSKIFKIKMLSFAKVINLYDKEIFFTKKFSEICDVILFGLSLKIPIILEGEAGQGKQTAIHYMANKLGLEIINIVISKSTKVDDLLLKIIIEKSKSGEIIVKNQETELYKAIKSTDKNPKKLILFQGINNASPAVLDVLNSIFIPDAKILLSNGSILEKGTMNIIGIFNKGRDNANKDKIPAGILSNCIYHIVDNPSSDDILNIITNLFSRMNFGDKENVKYTKNYLFDNGKEKLSLEAIDKKLKDKSYLEEKFKEAKEFEAEDFAKKFKDAKLFSLETTNESPFTLNDIRKYIDFRESVPQVNSSLIQLFIFVYHFTQEENIKKITDKLDLLKNIEFLPIIDYDENREHLSIFLEKEAKESIRVKVNNPENIKTKTCKKLFDTLTKSQKHCFIFLVCCIIAKKTPIIQGPTASGKSYLVSVFATLLGQETNLYQMNSNTGLSILTGQEIIKGDFDDDEKSKICEAYTSIKKLIKYNKDFNDMELKHYKKIISKIDKKLEKGNLDEKTIDLLKKARRTIFIIISPPSRFTHIDSVFIDSILKGKGQWVILDGIEMAPSQIPEKIAPLCGENPELSIFESGKGIYITSKDIKDNFQLFIIYNPFNKGSKILDPVLFNKCISFTLPSIDNSQPDSATIIYNSMKLKKSTNKNAWNIISSKLAASHMLSAKISENHLEQMVGGIKITPRNLAFLTTDRNKNKFDDNKVDETVNWIKSVLTFYYFNSFMDPSSDKKKEKTDNYTKEQFRNEIYEEFKKNQKLILTANDISEEEKFPEIVKCLLEIQISSINEITEYNFNFGQFVSLCLEVPIEQANLEYIKNQIEDTLNLLSSSNLKEESLFSFYQIKIVEKLYNELLENIGVIKVENKGKKLNSDELLKINVLKPILLRFRLLEGLTNKGKDNFGFCLNSVLYIPEINQLILKLNNLLLKKNKSALKEFVAFCKEYHHFLNCVLTIFPFNQFNKECGGTDFEVAFNYIKFMVEYYKNKTNFSLIFDNEEFSFIFEEKQFDRIFPILKINEKNCSYLSKDTQFKFYKTKKKMLGMSIIPKEEYINKDKTIQSLNFFRKYSGIINPENIENLYKTFNNDNNELISEKKFLTSNLFSSNNSISIIPKIWTLLLSFDDDSQVLDYIIKNLLPFERDIYLIIKNEFYNKLDNILKIENYLQFTEKMNFFYKEDSFLYRDLIGRKLEKNLRDEQYSSYANRIEKEISNLEILKEFSWPEGKINQYQDILNTILEEINDKIETEKKDIKLKKELKKLQDLRNKLSKMELKGGYEISRGQILAKINHLLKENLEIILIKRPEVEKEIEVLKSVSNDKRNVSLSGNNLNWGKPIVSAKTGEESQIIKLYKNMLYYATCNELQEKLLNAKEYKERIIYGNQLEKLGLISLLKYIYFIGDEALGSENRKKIKSMFRAQLMFDLWNNSIDQVSVKNFIQELNKRGERKSISELEYLYSYQIANEYSLTTKIIQPKFEPKDIIYLFFKYNENNEYFAGQIFDGINIHAMKMNNIYKGVIEEVNQKNSPSMLDISYICGETLYKELFNIHDEEKYNKKLDDFTFEKKEEEKEDYYKVKKLIAFFENEVKSMKESNEKKELEAIINALKLSEFYNGIIIKQKETLQNPINFEDMKIFKKINNERIDIESLLTQNINPSFKFYIIKNLQLLKPLINSELTNNDISILFQPQIDELYIPFWVFLIRNMSSINCINYENKNNPFEKEITNEVRENIEDLLNKGNANQLDNSWLNLILEIIPNEIEIINIRIFYYFFNNLFEKLNASSDYLKQRIQEILKEFYIELLKYSFDNKINTFLSEDIKTSNKDIFKLIKSPRDFIKDKIYNDYSDKTKSVMDKNKFQDLENNLKKMIDEIPEYIEKIKENVKMVEEIYEYEEEQDAVNSEIENIKLYLLEYNNKFENLKKKHKNIAFENQIHPEQIIDYENADKKIKKYKKLAINENEKLIYWKIPFKNEDISIKYDTNIQIYRGQNKYLYFRTEELDEQFKEKFTVLKSTNKKKAKKDIQKEILKLNDYIFFEKAEKFEITSYNIKADDELINIIKNNNLVKITKHTKVHFKGKNLKQILSMITDMNKVLLEMNDNIALIKNGNFEELNLKKVNNKYLNQYKDLIHYFDIKDNKQSDFSEISKIKGIFEKYLLQINKDFENLCEKIDEKLGKISNNLAEELKQTFIPNFDMPPLPKFKTHFINYDNLKSDSPLLSMPTISKRNGKLKCNYNKITFQKGPFCPEFYSKPIILNIMSLVDEEINAEIKEIPEEENKINEEKNEDDENKDDENEEENENQNENRIDEKENIEKQKEENKNQIFEINSGGEEENEEENDKGKEENDEEDNEENNLNENIKDIKVINRPDIDSYKYMKVKNYIQPKEPIQIEIYIPNLLTGKKEIQKIRRILKLTAGDTCEVEIEMQILTVPIQLLFSCQNYKLEFKNGSYYLKTNQLFLNEKLFFKIQNYIKGDSNKLKIRIDSLEGNTAKEPKINIEDENSFILEMPTLENNEVKRINCKIECFLSQNYKIPIRIDSVIMPINFTFQIYDYSNHVFTSNRVNLLLPTGNYENNNNFVKYFPENESEINLHLLISIPFKNKRIKAVIRTKPNNRYNNHPPIQFDFDNKEIEINKEKTEIICKIKINCGNIIYHEIGSLECQIEGKTQIIVIEKKDFNCDNINFNEIEMFKYDKNELNNTYNWVPIKDKEHIKKQGLYICQFGLWNYQIIKYIKTYDYSYRKYYYQLEPVPPDNKILFISQDGKITEESTHFQDYSYRSGFLWHNKTYNYPLLGKFGNEWYPLIIEYEKEEELFNIEHNYDSLKQIYSSSSYYYSFHDYLCKNYPQTYEELDKEHKLYYFKGENFNNYLNNIIKKMNKNKTLDILKRFTNKKCDSFNFSYLAYLIFEKTENTLNSFQLFLPDSIKVQLYEKINYILINLPYGRNDPKKFNETKLDLIKEIYLILKSKREEIENNNNCINLLELGTQDIIYAKIIEIKEKFYFYDSNLIKMPTKTDSIGQLSQDIEQIIQDISKTEQEEGKNENNKENQSPPILSYQFLITSQENKIVNKNAKPISKINLSEINNKSNAIDAIEIDDIIQPKIYSINSLMDYYGNCILKTQMLPAFIRFAVINNNEDDQKKATKILSELFNLYKILDQHNFSLISPRLEEYQKSFEIMFSKLKKSGVDFSNDQELKNLKFDDNNQIQDFIILPEKDNFIIRPSNFETEENNEMNTNNTTTNRTNRIIYNKTGIKSIQDSQMMNLEYENLAPANPKKEKRIRKKSQNIPKKSSVAKTVPPPIIKANTELQKVYTVLDDKTDIAPIKNNYNQPRQNNTINRKGLVKKKAEDKKIVINSKTFEGQNFDVEKEINRVIEKMKNISKKKLKLDEVSEREGKLDKLYHSDKLKELLKETMEIKDDSNINKLLESSEFLSSRIFSYISKLNLVQEIPFKNLEVNILLDCARTIGDTEKFYVILQVCALTTVLYSLEIPYLISVVGDSGFKVVLKELEEEHSIENLQKALDCIFIKRCNTNIASCIKTATDKFKSLDNDNAHRVFYMFTNGLDEEFALCKQWKDRIFINSNHSYAFIFSKPKTIKNEQSKYLTQFWDKFGKYCKDNGLPVELVEMSKEKLYIQDKNNLEINEQNVMAYIKSIINVLRRFKEKDNNDKTEKSIFEVKELKNIPLNKNLTNFGIMINDNSLREIKEEPYIKKIKLPQIQETVPKLSQKEFKELTKNIGSVLKVHNPINNDEKYEIKNFMKLFKIKKEKINLSLLDLIFKPNLATQSILTDVGTHIDVNELIKYFLNPTPNPRIYRELGDGFVKNYGVTVVIDSSISCFGPLSSQHTWNTIQILLSALGAIDLPCFDLIISGNPNPYIVCSEKNSLDILSEKSLIWPILFDLLNKNVKNTDLASAIKAAYNLHNSRKTEHPDFLFVLTDGLFSLSETQRIIKNVVFCMTKGLNVFGIGVGISPFGIEKLFPSIIYSLNPDKLIQGIASCFSGGANNSALKVNVSLLKMKFEDSTNIENAQKNPIYKALKNELMNIPVELSGYDYYQMEIPPDAKEEELTGDGKFSVHNYGMYEKNFFQGQKLLIVMPYSYGMNEGEDERLSYEYITKSKDNTECIQSSIDYTGIKAEVVINYKEAIERLTRPGTFKKDCCDYYACIIMSGEPYAELPNSNDDPYLFGQFINVIKQFWENGGGLGLFADNAPFNYQINVLIEKLFPNSNFRVAGNHPGTQTIYGDDTGSLVHNATFNRKIQMIDNYARNIISHSLNSIYEGKTISYFVEKPNEDDLLYYGKNEELKMITDPNLLKPFVPFSKDSDGGFNSVFYSSNDNKGDIVVDCSYTKFFLEMGTKGTPRYIQNIVSWLGAPEKHQEKDKCKDGTDFRPKAIDIQINWNDKWNGFKERPKNLSLPENMKTLFAVDCSGSISGREIYFRKLRELRLKYYNGNRGDKFYTWGSSYYYKTESEMDSFIANKYGRDGTCSYYIAEIGRVTKNENFEHLIIVTDGCVGTGDIDESERRVSQYGLQYSYVSSYIIGSGGNESVGCPFSRGCPGVTYIIDNYGNERQQASLSQEDQKALNNINSINHWAEFKSKYQNLFNAIRAKCLGRNADSDLKNKLNNLKVRITDAGSEQNDFINKFIKLYNMADGKIRDVNSAATAA